MPVRSSHSAEKRRKELDRKRRAQEKLERRQSRKKAAEAEGLEQPVPQDEIPTESDGGLAPPEKE